MTSDFDTVWTKRMEENVLTVDDDYVATIW